MGNLVSCAGRPWALDIWHHPPSSPAMQSKVLGLAGEEPVLPIQPAACCGGTSTPAAAAVPSSSVASQQLLSVLSLMKDASLGNKTWAFRSFKSSKKVIS